ncbi:TrkA C-terminal domain-containing protein [Sulfurimonas sp.]|uniref:TrkA C-terminal domain-containing protein n=1 Tax=Sulfurimonas sp. TaxID=2022749 RepID=UPI002B48C94D|nr:TrkA C-terminal domain-containing protein [Sulfurimonas sp.]
MQNNALLFGDNEFTIEIQNNISQHYKNVQVFKLNTDDEYSFDLSDDWDELSKKYDMTDCIVFCNLENMAENIFLTISLRDSFKHLNIIALSQDKESSDKLLLAGATRILPTTQTMANTIVEILEKPIVTKVFHDILYKNSALKIAEIKLKEETILDGKYPSDIEWSREHGIIVISIVHEDMKREFIYSSKEKHHMIKSGDTFVVVGYEQDIKDFKKFIGNKSE